MLAEIVQFELGIAAVITAATVTLPSIALACLLTLYFGRRLRPSMTTTLLIALGAATPWAAWLTLLMVVADRSEGPLTIALLLLAYLAAGLLGSVPAAFVTRQAAVMPRGRRAEDR